MTDLPPARTVPWGADDADMRVAAVLEVLAGSTIADVAARWVLDAALLERWVQAFVEAGTAQVTNRPVGEVARQRDRFLSMFMSGLRSPLAEAQGWVGLLHEPSRPAPEVVGRLQESLDRVHQSTLDVELLTAAMLGRLTLLPEPVRLGTLVSGLRPQPDLAPADADLVVEADPELFPRILRDLWAAAAHTLPAPDVVRLEVVARRPWVELRVVREGPPIHPTVLRALFEPFDAPDAAASASGLYLARALGVVHGGMTGVDQDEAGCTFWVRIPDLRHDGHETPHQIDETTHHEGDPR